MATTEISEGTGDVVVRNTLAGSGAQEFVGSVTAADSDTKVLADFTLFPNLPLDMRRQIRYHVLPSGFDGICIVRVRLSSDNRVENGRMIFDFEINKDAPKVHKACHDLLEIGLLSTCHESRDIIHDEVPLLASFS